MIETASWGRRVLALVVDWLASYGVAELLVATGVVPGNPASLATMAVFVVCLALYVSGAVKVTNKFIFVVVCATAGIFFFYLASFLLQLFGVDLTFWTEPSALGIGISVAICFVAALNLFVDFEMIRRMVVAGAPKQMEWYGAVGITITIVCGESAAIMFNLRPCGVPSNAHPSPTTAR